MANWTVISKQQHAAARYRPREGYAHARGQIVAPVLLSELSNLVNQYVLGFLADGENTQLVALLGYRQGRNLYVHEDGRWIGDYVPATVRGYPFALAPGEGGNLVLCIDADRFVASSELGGSRLPLFDEDGQAVQEVVNTLGFLEQCQSDAQRTQAAVSVLRDAGLLKPWNLTLDLQEGQPPQRIEGLQCIDEQAMNTLAPEAFAKLQGAPMAVAYAHLFTVQRTRHLQALARLHNQHESPELPDDLDRFFDGDDDLNFSFD